jgi:colicin import membrane protein
MIPYERRDQGPGWMFIISLALHILIIFICSNANLFRATLHEATPYYVDIVSLPAVDASPAEPQGAQAVSPSPPAPAAPPKSPAAPAMTIPVKPAPNKPIPAVAPPANADQEAREFAERMNRLERNSEARHEASALESIKKKLVEQKPGGGGAAKGTGADYGSYIQSRLKDALASTIAIGNRSQKSEARVHLYIDKSGKLIRYVMIRPSSDKVFNDSVIRTIEKAKANFPPNPAGSDFEKLFVFSPQEVSK